MQFQKKVPNSAVVELAGESQQVKVQVVVKGCAVKNLVLVAVLDQVLKEAKIPYRRLPKLKGFPMVNRKKYTIINVSKLSSLPANTEVTLASLIKVGIITTDDGPLKILGDGDLNIPLKVYAAAFTASARSKIEAAGGSCEEIGPAQAVSNEDSTKE